MRSKKAEGEWGTIVKAAVALMIILVMAGLIYSLFVGKQVATAGELTETATKDCDGDGAVGLTDDCPCNKDITKLKDGQKCEPRVVVENSKTCPSACKK
jgi:hypothetical protein